MNKRRTSKKPAATHLGPTLLRLLAHQDLRQSQICQEIGMTPAQMSNFLRGHKDISSTNLILLLQALGIDLEKLIRHKLGHYESLSEGMKSQLDLLPESEQSSLSAFLLAFQERYQKDLASSRQDQVIHA